MATPETTPPPIFSLTSIISLASVAVLLGIAYITSNRALHPSTSTKLRVLFIWHLFDFLVHSILEGSYLYNCFFTYVTIPGVGETPLPSAIAARYTPENVFFLGHENRLYGSFYGTGNNVFAALWRVYAEADHRWGGASLEVISLEILTVFLMGPLALFTCYLISTNKIGKAWFVATIVATGELYGGFMTFAPEWLTGSPNLDTSNFMYLWVYLFFFNTIWVWIPLWILYEAYKIFDTVGVDAGSVISSGKGKKVQ